MASALTALATAAGELATLGEAATTSTSILQLEQRVRDVSNAVSIVMSGDDAHLHAAPQAAFFAPSGAFATVMNSYRKLYENGKYRQRAAVMTAFSDSFLWLAMDPWRGAPEAVAVCTRSCKLFLGSALRHLLPQALHCDKSRAFEVASACAKAVHACISVAYKLRCLDAVIGDDSDAWRMLLAVMEQLPSLKNTEAELVMLSTAPFIARALKTSKRSEASTAFVRSLQWIPAAALAAMLKGNTDRSAVLPMLQEAHTAQHAERAHASVLSFASTRVVITHHKTHANPSQTVLCDCSVGMEPVHVSLLGMSVYVQPSAVGAAGVAGAMMLHSWADVQRVQLSESEHTVCIIAVVNEHEHESTTLTLPSAEAWGAAKVLLMDMLPPTTQLYVAGMASKARGRRSSKSASIEWTLTEHARSTAAAAEVATMGVKPSSPAAKAADDEDEDIPARQPDATTATSATAAPAAAAAASLGDSGPKCSRSADVTVLLDAGTVSGLPTMDDQDAASTKPAADPVPFTPTVDKSAPASRGKRSHDDAHQVSEASSAGPAPPSSSKPSALKKTSTAAPQAEPQDLNEEEQDEAPVVRKRAKAAAAPAEPKPPAARSASILGAVGAAATNKPAADTAVFDFPAEGAAPHKPAALAGSNMKATKAKLPVTSTRTASSKPVVGDGSKAAGDAFAFVDEQEVASTTAARVRPQQAMVVKKAPVASAAASTSKPPRAASAIPALKVSPVVVPATAAPRAAPTGRSKLADVAASAPTGTADAVDKTESARKQGAASSGVKPQARAALPAPAPAPAIVAEQTDMEDEREPAMAPAAPVVPSRNVKGGSTADAQAILRAAMNGSADSHDVGEQLLGASPDGDAAAASTGVTGWSSAFVDSADTLDGVDAELHADAETLTGGELSTVLTALMKRLAAFGNSDVPGSAVHSSATQVSMMFRTVLTRMRSEVSADMTKKRGEQLAALQASMQARVDTAVNAAGAQEVQASREVAAELAKLRRKLSTLGAHRKAGDAAIKRGAELQARLGELVAAMKAVREETATSMTSIVDAAVQDMRSIAARARSSTGKPAGVSAPRTSRPSISAVKKRLPFSPVGRKGQASGMGGFGANAMDVDDSGGAGEEGGLDDNVGAILHMLE